MFLASLLVIVLCIVFVGAVVVFNVICLPQNAFKNKHRPDAAAAAVVVGVVLVLLIINFFALKLLSITIGTPHPRDTWKIVSPNIIHTSKRPSIPKDLKKGALIRKC